jgi:outer membrane assembly lipoprotein YfiO
MTIHSARLFSAILLITALLPFAHAAEDSFTETLEDNRKFHLFGGPKKEGPEAQWDYCQELVEKEKFRKAIRHAKYLVQTWPDHPRAVEAQRLRADLHFAKEEYQFAFDAYQELIENFAGLFDYNDVLTQQLECARKLENKVYKAFFGLNTYQQPLEAIPLYRQVLVNAPHIRDAPEILFTIGNIYMGRKQYINAVAEYDRLEQQFPDSPFSELAALRRAEAYQERARQTPTDVQPLEAELMALNHFLETYPDSERIPDARLRMKSVYDRLAELRFEKGVFYQESLREPEAALTIYRSLLEQYPDSEWTVQARERILSLTQEP